MTMKNSFVAMNTGSTVDAQPINTQHNTSMQHRHGSSDALDKRIHFCQPRGREVGRILLELFNLIRAFNQANLHMRSLEDPGHCGTGGADMTAQHLLQGFGV